MTDAVMSETILQPSRIPGGKGGYLEPARTSESARELARKRWDKAEAVARRALKQETGASNSMLGWMDVVAGQVRIAVKAEKGSTQAAAFVGRAAGLLRERDSVAGGVDGGGLTVTMGAEVARDLLAMVRAKMDSIDKG